MVRTLKNLSDLRETGFGRPSPRHGLKLLWWFAHDCVQIDSNGRMTALCNPEYGDFGFHRFYNGDGLLPYFGKYYEVGNLNTPGSLPGYVTEHHTGYSDDSNTDRIIVSFNSSCNRLEKIYVTQHSDEVNFDQNRTYNISLDLLKDIQELRLKEFLRESVNDSSQISYKMQCRHTPFPSPAQSAKSEPYQSQTVESIKDVCAKCCKMLFYMFLFICVVFLILIAKI
ncbi:uncharacterized protein LOC122341330 [Puntigrus tetrazona]|uniref:uncharacterized protein LOC122341330 n=1 Tax=Puntigrus tetrazona TaxID=1606681 RepID=UPI001C8ABF2D|nr:uncharacterized protein LOC122341330 [Puntigrus tetrazona]